jgi:hypothetical protein
VSGDVTLVDGGDGATSRLVRTAATLFGTPGFAPAALVGGLAVTCQLATVHRATNDVDTVADGDRPGDLALEYLGDSDAGAGRIEIEGVTVDVMATHPIDERDLPDDELARLFVVGHRWALETATSLAVDVVAGVRASNRQAFRSRPCPRSSPANSTRSPIGAMRAPRSARATRSIW